MVQQVADEAVRMERHLIHGGVRSHTSCSLTMPTWPLFYFRRRAVAN